MSANWFYLAGSACFAIGTVINMARATDPAPDPPTTTTTTADASFCDPHGSGARIYPGTGIIPSHDTCPQPPLEHAPAGTGPNTGPRGERE